MRDDHRIGIGVGTLRKSDINFFITVLFALLTFIISNFKKKT